MFLGYRGVANVITERKIAEAKLRATNAEFKLVLDNVPTVITRVDKHLNFVLVNATALRWYGVTHNEIIGKNVKDVFGEEACKKVLPYLQRALSGETISFETTMAYPDGETRSVLISYLPEKAANGDVMGFISMAADISEKKKLEAFQLKARDDLEEKVKLRTAELQAARNEAEAANEIKSEMITTMSHELRTPLTSIVGSLRILADRSVEIDEASRAELLNIAQRNSDQLTVLVHDIVNIERLDAGATKLDKKIINLSDTVQEAVGLNVGYASEKGTVLNLSQVTPDIFVDGDKTRLLQVMANLISNACKFSPVGGTISISVSNDERRAKVEISDKGPGISDEIRSAIFEKYIRGDTTDSRNSSGAGLGSSIAKSIIELHAAKLGLTAARQGERPFSF